MHLLVDLREHELITHLRLLCTSIPAFSGVEIKTANLPLGDIIVVDEEEPDEEKRELVIVERKCLSDLLASISDGRYDEQSFRLQGLPNIHNHNIMYLVEGDVTKFGNRFKPSFQADKLKLYSTMFSLSYYKGFSVMRTLSLEESAFFLCNTLVKMKREKLLKKKTPFYSSKSNMNMNSSNLVQPDPVADATTTTTNHETPAEEEETTEEPEKGGGTAGPNYVAVARRVKKENVTSQNIDEIMLCQIPGISTVIAAAILEKYKSLHHLLNELERNRAAGNAVLEDVTYTNSKGQVRRINRSALENLSKYLCRE